MTKLEEISGKINESWVATLLKIVGAVILAGLTGWWTSYLTQKSVGENKRHEKLGEHVANSSVEARTLLEQVNTDLEGFFLNTRQDTKAADERGEKLEYSSILAYSPNGSRQAQGV